MATAIPGQVWLAAGFRPQSDWATANTAAQMWSMQTDRETPVKATAGHETDQGETGVGTEWAKTQYKTAFSAEAELPMKASIEWLIWALRFGFGAGTPVGTAPTVYTMTPKARSAAGNTRLDPFTLACQVGPIGDETAHFDEALVGCAVAGFSLSVQNGVSRSDVALTTRIVGIGKFSSPSGLVLPAVLEPKFPPSASLELSSLSRDYVAQLAVNSLEFEWDNDVTLRRLGGGVQDGYATAAAVEFGQGRGGVLRFNADFVAAEHEIDKVRDMDVGTATFAIQESADERVEVTFERVRLGEAEFVNNERGIGLQVEHRLFYDPSEGLITAVGRTAQANIGVAA